MMQLAMMKGIHLFLSRCATANVLYSDAEISEAETVSSARYVFVCSLVSFSPADDRSPSPFPRNVSVEIDSDEPDFAVVITPPRKGSVS